MTRKLPHYLRTERRRHGLTQADVAALLGGPWRSRVSLYERGALPPVQVALAYEAIFGRPVADLLGGVYDETAAMVRERARQMLADERLSSSRHLLRRDVLERIAA
jgi:transcriptional regulator with XRE-family HTH domain